MFKQKTKTLEKRIEALESALDTQFDLYNNLFKKYEDMLVMVTGLAKIIEDVALIGSRQGDTIQTMQQSMGLLIENYKKLISQIMRTEDFMDDSNIKSTRIH